jgi:hypothetical protein
MKWNWEDALKTAILIGLSVSEFDEMTPYELMIFLEAYTEKEEADLQEAVTLVWLGEYYHRLKRLPALKGELKKFLKNEQEMTDEEMLDVVKTLNAQFGGSFVNKGGE